LKNGAQIGLEPCPAALALEGAQQQVVLPPTSSPKSSRRSGTRHRPRFHARLDRLVAERRAGKAHLARAAQEAHDRASSVDLPAPVRADHRDNRAFVDAQAGADAGLRSPAIETRAGLDL